MRVTVSKKACVNISVVEYAKKLSIDKYYKDKVKAVSASAIYFKIFQKNSSNVKFIPSIFFGTVKMGELYGILGGACSTIPRSIHFKLDHEQLRHGIRLLCIVCDMLIARLEGELLIYYKTDRSWFAVEKIDDIDAPQSIDDIRKGSIKLFMKSLKYLKVMNI